MRWRPLASRSLGPRIGPRSAWGGVSPRRRQAGIPSVGPSPRPLSSSTRRPGARSRPCFAGPNTSKSAFVSSRFAVSSSGLSARGSCAPSCKRPQRPPSALARPRSRGDEPPHSGDAVEACVQSWAAARRWRSSPTTRPRRRARAPGRAHRRSPRRRLTQARGSFVVSRSSPSSPPLPSCGLRAACAAPTDWLRVPSRRRRSAPLPGSSARRPAPTPEPARSGRRRPQWRRHPRFVPLGARTLQRAFIGPRQETSVPAGRSVRPKASSSVRALARPPLVTGRARGA